MYLLSIPLKGGWCGQDRTTFEFHNCTVVLQYVSSTSGFQLWQILPRIANTQNSGICVVSDSIYHDVRSFLLSLEN